MDIKINEPIPVWHFMRSFHVIDSRKLDSNTGMYLGDNREFRTLFDGERFVNETVEKEFKNGGTAEEKLKRISDFSIQEIITPHLMDSNVSKIS